MEIKGINLDSLNLKDLEKPEIAGFSAKEALDIFGKERVNSLKKSIHEIEQLIEERKKLSLEFIKEGDAIKSEINNLILTNETTLRALGQSEALSEKNALRNKKIEISELQLNEKIDCWKDIALLKKELRIHEKELSEKEHRIRELNELLERGD